MFTGTHIFFKAQHLNLEGESVKARAVLCPSLPRVTWLQFCPREPSEPHHTAAGSPWPPGVSSASNLAVDHAM